MATLAPEVNAENQWRTETPDPTDWARSPRPGADKKYYICSVDGHITPPRDLFARHIDAKFRDRLPKFVVENGEHLMIVDGLKPFRVVQSQLEGEDAYRSKAGTIGDDVEADVAARFADMDKDGIDYEIIFPNGPALTAYSSPDTEFVTAQLAIYNDWAMELNARYRDRMYIAPCISTGNVETAIAEIQRVAALGAHSVSLPTQPIAGLENSKLKYNHKMFEPLWDCIEETNQRIVIHVATGGDPRKARGPGGAIMNRAFSHEAMVDPITAFCASGILDRHPELRFGCFEGGIGWIPALLDLMDETYVKHHMWVFPKLNHGLPSEYFKEHAVASFQEDRAGLLLAEPYGLEKNICWSNDYPHHEGTWPHSAAAIERAFGHLKEETRAAVLGLNAARFFDLKVPAHLA
jgi:predicted TIM-barrel fold metal-dependent hydrolase